MLGAGLQFGRSRGGEDRFYNPAKARRNRRNQESLRRAQTDVTLAQSTSSSGTEEPENRIVKPTKTVALEPSVLAASSPVCNLERFLESVTPSVPAQHPSKQRTMRGWMTSDVYQPYFVLDDLWESFKEWSAYGAGVPLILDGTDSVIQYYVPYLSGIQIYGDPLKPSLKTRQPAVDSDSDSYGDSYSDASSDYEHQRGSLHSNRHPDNEMCRRMNQLSVNDQHHVLQEGFSSDDSDSVSTQGCLLFEYMERNQPWGREPLADKILDLARCFPELRSLRSCDLLPSSWLSVAWYPIYRIPMGPTLKDLDACFLTFHSLHTPMTGNQCEHPPVVSYPNGTDGIPMVSLPVFGLASYKFKPPLWVHNERTLVSDLLQAADRWLNMLQVNHPDYLFFSRR
ncbi:hypothetical protein L1987_06525 [Smallanthus sonchifolius]|uniref:Uncharacterized protein n=1 Tax=Smallanthus sonchifolius TaxID=185202 RepID=A0ACB9JYR9_9ASTR|nr:hypothetical protein L1987_06525 [Smallanthus sonchifolius]